MELVEKKFDDIAHGFRGGGALHNVASFDNHGFMSSSDKLKLDTIVTTSSFTMAAAATKVVADTKVTATNQILLFPTNAAAATLMGGVKSLYVSARTDGTSFTVATADGTAAAGTETFNYKLVP